MTETPKCPVPECGKPLIWRAGLLTCESVACRGHLSMFHPAIVGGITIAPLPVPPTLKLCPNPACRSGLVCLEEDHDGDPLDVVWCKRCGMRGPERDLDGSKWNALPRRGEYADNLIVFERCGKRAPKGGELFLMVGTDCIDCAGHDWANTISNEREILRRVHPPEPRPETKPAERIPWPEWASDLNRFRFLPHPSQYAPCEVFVFGQWRNIGAFDWLNEGTYRRVTVNGKDFAEKVDNG